MEINHKKRNKKEKNLNKNYYNKTKLATKQMIKIKPHHLFYEILKR
jgi:hypothetical protein